MGGVKTALDSDWNCGRRGETHNDKQTGCGEPNYRGCG